MTQVKEQEPRIQAPEPRAHPLEPLTKAEVEAVVLNEPAKEAVLGYGPGDQVEREAFVVLLDNATGQCVEAVVSLDRQSVTSWLPRDGAQPAIMLDEFVECEEAVKRSPEFLEALRKRGVDDVDLVMIDPWSAGSYGVEPEDDKGRRLSRALAWVRSEPTDNGYARPLEGVIVVVDLNKMEVLRVEDYGVVPLAPESGNWTRGHITETRTDSKPLEIIQREGRGTGAVHGRLRGRGPDPADPVPRVAVGHGSALRRSGRVELPQERVRHRRVRDRAARQPADARLRLPRRDPVLRRAHGRQPGPAGHH